MQWYVIQTKPRQEFRAEENLKNQGYEIFLPTSTVEKLLKSQIKIQKEPLFSRYLFIRLDQISSNWAPVRSTRGVSNFLRFGAQSTPSVVNEELIDLLKTKSEQQNGSKPLFNEHDLIRIKEGPFKDQEGLFQKMITTNSGEIRALLLIELLGKQQRVALPIQSIQTKI